MNFKIKLNLKKIKFSKNLVITATILLITIISSLFIFSVIINLREKNQLAEKDFKKQSNKLNEINRHNPSPTNKNINLIKKDVKYIKQQLFMFHTKLGNPYIQPLENFLSVITKNDTATEKTNQSMTLPLYDFLNSWVNFYKKYNINIRDYDACKSTFKAFLKTIGGTEAKYEKALKAFRNTLQNNSYEEINEILAQDYLLNSIGFPLKITRIQCKELINKIQDKLITELHNNDIISSSQKFILFDEFSAMPEDNQIPYIINYLWFYQDLTRKIIESNIESFLSPQKINGLKGEDIGDILVLKYEFDVIGTLSSIRMLIDKFQSAYKNNKVYSVDFLSFNKAIDNASKLPVPKTRKRELKIEMLIGTSELVKAKIRISYYIYNKPIIKL